MLNTDLPYLQPLLFWLRNDVNLKNYFTQKSFFMPKNDLEQAVADAIKNDCPAPRALWILPQETRAITQSKPGCSFIGEHKFLIEIIVQCIYDNFVIKKNEENELYLGGQFMLLSEVRKAVKKSVSDFSKQSVNNGKYKDLTWVSDRMLYPNEETNFLITSLEFSVKIF